jgi:hypothetical protein
MRNLPPAAAALFRDNLRAGANITENEEYDFTGMLIPATLARNIGLRHFPVFLKSEGKKHPQYLRNGGAGMRRKTPDTQ